MCQFVERHCILCYISTQYLYEFTLRTDKPGRMTDSHQHKVTVIAAMLIATAGHLSGRGLCTSSDLHNNNDTP